MIKAVYIISVIVILIFMPLLPTIVDLGLFASRWAAVLCLYFSAQFLIAVAVGRVIAGPQN